MKYISDAVVQRAWFGAKAALGARGGPDVASADALREAVAAFIEATPEAAIGGTPVRDWIQWESGGDVGAYCRRMRGSGEWGGAIEIAVFSRLFAASVHVFEKERGDAYRRISAFDAAEGDESKVVRVLYSGRCHYDALQV